MASTILPEFAAALRQNFAVFVEKTFGTIAPGEIFAPNWSIEAVAWALTDVSNGNCNRLIINLPPRHLKSIMASVAFPAWYLGHHPERKIICASYGQDLADKFSRDMFAVMNTDWYREAFPAVRFGPKATESFFETDMHGFRKSTSLGGSLTGFGANLIVIDDPMKAGDAMSETERRRVIDWYEQSLYSRLNNKAEDAIVIVMQRLHEDDLTGHLLHQEGWKQISIPAKAPSDLTYKIGPDETDERVFKGGSLLDPARNSEDELERIRRNSGSRVFSAQYMQDPLPADGDLFNWSWFRFYDPRLLSTGFLHFVFQSWDVATSEDGDYSVCTTWGVVGVDRYYLLDVSRYRIPFPELLTKAKNLENRFLPDVILIEAIGTGHSFYQVLSQNYGQRITRAVPNKSKSVRAEAITPLIESGHVYLPSSAAWLDDFRREMLSFPHGKHDDQVDSFVQFLEYRRELIHHARNFGLCRHGGHAAPILSAAPNVFVTVISPQWNDLSEIDSFVRHHF